MKKLLAILLTVLLVFATLTGCSEKQGETSSNPTSSAEETVSAADDDVIDEDLLDEDYDDEDFTDEDYDDFEDDDYSEDYSDDYSDEDDGSDYDDDQSDEDYTDDTDEDLSDNQDEVLDEETSATISELRQRAELIKAGQDEEVAKSALYSEGNLVRLANALNKAKNGETINVVYFGGTNSSLVEGDSPSDSLKYLTQNWFSDEFNNMNVNVYARGHTTLSSIEACHRVEQDVLNFDADIVFLDFSVQDSFFGMGKSNSVGYDTLVYRILNSSRKPAVISLLLPGAEQTSYTDNAINCDPISTSANYIKQISKYYDIPVLDCETAIWDVVYGLVEVTEKTEQPVIFWTDISYNSITLNDTGHNMLFSMIRNLFEVAMAKYTKVVSVPAIPTTSYYSNAKYMNGSLVTISDIVEGKASGYGLSLDFSEKATQYGYTYKNNGDNYNGVGCSQISATRHYISTEEKYDENEINPHYLTFTLPEVTGTSYIVYSHTRWFTSKDLAEPFEYGALTFQFYDANDVLKGNTRCAGGAISDSDIASTYNQIVIPAGTTKIVVKVYSLSSAVYFHGIANY